MIPDKFFPDIDGVVPVGKFLSFLCCNVNLFITLADIYCNGYDTIVPVSFL